MLLLGERMVRHRAAEDHDVPDHQRRRRSGVAGCGVVGQIDQAAVAEGLDQPAGGGVDGHQVRRADREDAPVAVRFPPGDAPVGRAARRLVAEERRVLHPEGLAGAGVERLHEADAVRGVEHAAGHDRRRTELVRVAQRRPPLAERRVDRLAAPRDPQVAHRLRVDLVQRGVAREARVAAVNAPLAGDALLRPRRAGRGQRRHQEQGAAEPPAGRACDPDGAFVRAWGQGAAEPPAGRACDPCFLHFPCLTPGAAARGAPVFRVGGGSHAGHCSAEYAVGSRIRASMPSTSLRSSSCSTATMISWKSSNVPSSRHISSRAARDG